MKTLLVMRHAKPNSDNSEWSDFERPLSSDGLQIAPFMGNVIYKSNLQPQLIVSSPAKSAKQTAILVKEVAEIKSIEFVERIYGASPTTLLNLVSGFQEKYDSVLLVGHNPSIEELVRLLTGQTEILTMASIAKITLNIEKWEEITQNCGCLDLIINSNDLIERVNIAEFN